MKALKLSIALSALLTGTSAQANWQPLSETFRDFRPYLSAGAGVATGVDSKETTSMFRVGGGVKIGRYIAVEANYMRLGEMENETCRFIEDCNFQKEPGETTMVGSFINKEISELSGFGAGLVGYIPFGPKTRIIARTDIMSLNRDLTSLGFSGDFEPREEGEPPAEAPTPLKQTSSSKVTYYGLGLGFERKLSTDTFIRTQAEYFSPSFFGGDSDKGEGFYTVNLQLKYRL